MGDEESKPASIDTYELIRDLILTGELAPGTRMKEEDVAARAEVSRTPVREALRRLQAEGYVEFEPRRGATVATWSASEIFDLFGLRGGMDEYIIELAAIRWKDEAEIDRLDAMAEEMHSLAASIQRAEPDSDGQPRRETQATLVDLALMNRRFHQGTHQLAGSPKLAAAVASVMDVSLVTRAWVDYWHSSGWTRSLEDHRELLIAIRRRDAEYAGAIARAHVLNARTGKITPPVAEPGEGGD